MYRATVIVMSLLSAATVTARGGSAWRIDAEVVDRSAGRVSTSKLPVLFTRRYLKIGLPGTGRRESDLLHDRQTGNCCLVDHANKSYVQINTKAMSAVGDAARTVGDAIREGVGKLTGTAPPPKPALRIETSGQTQTVAGMLCHHFTIRRGKTLVQEIWATSWKQAGIERKDMEVLRDLARAMNQPALTSLLGLTTDGRYSLTEGLLQVDGYPVVFVQYEKERPLCRIRMNRPRRTEAGAATFHCPPSYRLGLPAVQ